MRNFHPMLLTLIITSLIIPQICPAQQIDTVDGRVITLSEVIVRSKTDVRGFMERVKSDTSFYKAFRNLRILEFSSLNDIRMYDKKGKEKATLDSRTRQYVNNGCRYTKKEAEQSTGDFYNKKGGFNYYTAELYSGLLFAFDTVCGETNIVKGAELNVKNKKGIEKNKEQLKMLFFNPGMKIPGIPLMGHKAALFEDDMSKWYNYSIDIQEKNGKQFYVFTVHRKSREEGGDPDKVVIDEMATWFNYQTFEVESRNYSLSYDAGVYDFNVQMEVQLSHYRQWLVPTLIRYNGTWNVITKKREKGVFTATLFDFAEGMK
jgi:hypothetical protein